MESCEISLVTKIRSNYVEPAKINDVDYILNKTNKSTDRNLKILSSDLYL